MCGLKVEGENKWKTLIQNASKNKQFSFQQLVLCTFSSQYLINFAR
jgi:hypothetical protein